MIPAQLQNPAFRFIKVAAKSKRPIEDRWQDDANYQYDSPSLLQHLQADGKIGPGARPPCWQITEERKAAIWHAVAVLKENDPDDEHLWDEEIAVLRAMLTEAGQ